MNRAIRVGQEAPLSAGMLVAWALIGAIAIAAVPLTLSIRGGPHGSGTRGKR